MYAITYKRVIKIQERKQDEVRKPMIQTIYIHHLKHWLNITTNNQSQEQGLEFSLQLVMCMNGNSFHANKPL